MSAMADRSKSKAKGGGEDVLSSPLRPRSWTWHTAPKSKARTGSGSDEMRPATPMPRNGETLSKWTFFCNKPEGRQKMIGNHHRANVVVGKTPNGKNGMPSNKRHFGVHKKIERLLGLTSISSQPESRLLGRKKATKEK